MIEKNRSTSPFVLLKIEMLRDPKFQELSLAEKMLWIFLRAEYNPNDKRCTNPATGEKQVYLSYAKLRKIQGFKSTATIWKAKKGLIKKNWIKVTEQGGLCAGESAYSFIGKYSPYQNNVKKEKGRKQG